MLSSVVSRGSQSLFRAAKSQETLLRNIPVVANSRKDADKGDFPTSKNVASQLPASPPGNMAT